ncbi:DUF2911 domain-containing protein [Fulvivirga lutimaris]|uniref:DUF2911 domain-containing protein n=1 Tax=Fulvivirga lutimaris TaxID=1819566 RepID=UPI0012BC8CE0|nr:DUF2911 domain-containing protein [Fulvivirga lutimaris]MTI41107.1 DUF2911 domain-containing protein [Fulvivirga lutimaris]
MKNLTFVLAFILVTSVSVSAQSFRGVDKSPLDVAYFPDNFAHDRKDDQKAIMKVTYSRPAKKDRDIFGKLVDYDKVWRTGANEATEIKLYQDVTFGGTKIPAGTYSIFTIPTATDWTIIFSSDLDYWGSYRYNKDNDVARVMAKSKEGKDVIENFSIQFDESGSSAGVMRLGWDKVIVELPFTY